MTTYTLRHEARPWSLLFDKFTVGDGCWEWTASINGSGYGEFMSRRWPKATRLAHRLVYMLLVGDIPDGLDLDHLCRNRRCVRPSHLEPVTRRENLLRGNTVTARNALATHCVNGHEFDASNTHTLPDGKRRCRACNRDSERRRRAAQR